MFSGPCVLDTVGLVQCDCAVTYQLNHNVLRTKNDKLGPQSARLLDSGAIVYRQYMSVGACVRYRGTRTFTKT